MDQLTLTDLEQHEYARAKKNSMHFLNISGEDYLGCRCCILNDLLRPGYVLGQQAIEKLVKSILYTLAPEQYSNKLHHSIKFYIDCVNTLDENLIPYNPLVDKLDKIYNALRYPPKPKENPPSNYGLSTDQLDDFDEYYWSLIEIHPIPDEVKYKTLLFNYLFETGDFLKLIQDAGIRENKALAKRMDRISNRYREVQEHNKLG